jgi:hypothetical protein
MESIINLSEISPKPIGIVGHVMERDARFANSLESNI